MLAGCGAGDAVDKYGRPTGPRIELKIGAADPEDPDLAFFVDSVARHSAGSVLMRVEQVSDAAGKPGEPALVAAVRSGLVAVAFVPSHLWAAVDPEWEAAQVPFLLTSTAAGVEFARSRAARDLLDAARHQRAIGLAVIPGQSRRLVAATPVVSPADLEGLTVRIDAVQTEATLSALGARPIADLGAGQARAGLRSGELDAVVAAPAATLEDSYHLSAPYISDLGLPPVITLALAHPGRWRRMPTKAQQALQTAGAETAEHAARAALARESGHLQLLCQTGAVIIAPPVKLQPARAARVATAGLTEPVRRRLDEIRAQVPSAGSRSSAAPSSCPIASTAAEGRGIRNGSTDLPASSSTGPRPTGTYVAVVSAEMWSAGSVDQADPGTDIAVTTVIDTDGTWRREANPGPRREMSGRWSLAHDQLTFFVDGDALSVEVVHWSYYRGVLRLEPLQVTDRTSRAVYAMPWRRVG